MTTFYQHLGIENNFNKLNMEQIIEIKKNKTNYVQIELREYEGHKYVDVREFYDDKEGRRLPTKKGITLYRKAKGWV